MNQLRNVAETAIVFLVLALLPTPAWANGEGAEVFNRGDGLKACFCVAGATYKGPATLIRTPDGKVRGEAQTRLISGRAVTKTTYTTLKFNTPWFGTIHGEIKLKSDGKGKIQFYNLP